MDDGSTQSKRRLVAQDFGKNAEIVELCERIRNVVNEDDYKRIHDFLQSYVNVAIDPETVSAIKQKTESVRREQLEQLESDFHKGYLMLDQRSGMELGELKNITKNVDDTQKYSFADLYIISLIQHKLRIAGEPGNEPTAQEISIAFAATKEKIMRELERSRLVICELIEEFDRDNQLIIDEGMQKRYDQSVRFIDKIAELGDRPKASLTSRFGLNKGRSSGDQDEMVKSYFDRAKWPSFEVSAYDHINTATQYYLRTIFGDRPLSGLTIEEGKNHSVDKWQVFHEMTPTVPLSAKEWIRKCIDQWSVEQLGVQGLWAQRMEVKEAQVAKDKAAFVYLSPSDIEAPTLDWSEAGGFSERAPIKARNVPVTRYEATKGFIKLSADSQRILDFITDQANDMRLEIGSKPFILPIVLDVVQGAMEPLGDSFYSKYKNVDYLDVQGAGEAVMKLALRRVHPDVKRSLTGDLGLTESQIADVEAITSALFQSLKSNSITL